MTKFTQEQVDDLNSRIKTAEGALEWASDNLHPKVAKASSFGAEDSVIMDIMLKINPKFRFFTLDTGRLPQETYDIIDIVRKKYNITIEVLFPDPHHQKFYFLSLLLHADHQLEKNYLLQSFVQVCLKSSFVFLNKF